MRVAVFVEGLSDTETARRIIEHVGLEIFSGPVATGGKGSMDAKISNYAKGASMFAPIVLFRDGDGECPVELVARIVPNLPDNRYFVLRVACTMTETWLMADRDGFAKFFGVSKAKVPREPEELSNAKRTVMQLCGKSSKRSIRDGMVAPGERPGPLYTKILNDFARSAWSIEPAMMHSNSLRRAVDRLGLLAQSTSA